MLNIYQKLNEIEQNGHEAALCTIISSSGSTPRKSGTKMIVYANKSIFGTIGGGALEHRVIDEAIKILQQGIGQTIDFNLHDDLSMSCGGTAQVFIEPIETPNKLYIFGGGHIGKFLASMAIQLNFSVTVIDERAAIFDNYDCNIKQLNLTPQEAFKQINFNSSSYFCIATHTHALDKEIVAHCAKQAFKYLGMIGSKSKIAKIKADILANDQVTEEQTEKINWPMGIKMACQTPQEIAVSILAKLIDVRHN